LGITVDAASRGLATLLLERHDFAKGTSSRSTKLIHGGVRYLQNGDVRLVLEALKERGIMRRNAPHLVRECSFVIPTYDWWESPFYGAGLKIYDLMAGKLGLGPTRLLSREETQRLIPNVRTAGLKGGVMFSDGQFDDARMAIALARTAVDHGACVLNYVGVTDFIKNEDAVVGVWASDALIQQAHQFRARVVINATGVFAAELIKLDEPIPQIKISPAQGTHLVLDDAFLSGKHAILVPHTSDGRVLFAVPWQGKVVVGTTDHAVTDTPSEPQARRSEVDFILEHAGAYMTRSPKSEDVRSVFCGLRPLISGDADASSSQLSRSHQIHVARSGLIHVLGGKWTTYRKMAEDAVDAAQSISALPDVPCRTATLPIHGYDPGALGVDPDFGSLMRQTVAEVVNGLVGAVGGLVGRKEGNNPVVGDGEAVLKFAALATYGTDLHEMMKRYTPADFESISQLLFLCPAQVKWAVAFEMAQTLEDVLVRRTACLFLDVEESLRMAPQVAAMMADLMSCPQEWVAQQIDAFTQTARYFRMPEH
ncbi:MAG: glycerol-3-phosphate dehydrogenase/oxidase, partial [Bacteroidota bacterium]